MSERDEAWADEPDAWEASDDAWDQKWSDTPPDVDADGEPLQPPPAGYRNEPVTANRVTRAYTEGMRASGSYTGLGYQIAGTMAIFVGIGYGVDRWLGTEPWGVVLGALLAFVGILALVVRVANEANEASRKKYGK